MKKPYIGITGFMNRNEVESILGLFPQSSNRILMVGILVSQKTLDGQQNKWPGRYPKIEKVAEICVNHSKALNLVHFNAGLSLLFNGMIRVTNLAGPHFGGFQLNVSWPSPFAIKEYKLRYPESVIVLQIGELAYKMVGYSPRELAQKVEKEYSGIIDYVLLDLSGGYGKPLDTIQARNCLEALRERDLDVGLVVAGGLSPSSLNLIKPLVKDFPDLSIDAEGRLRNKDDDSLNSELAKGYVLRTFDLFEDN